MKTAMNEDKEKNPSWLIATRFLQLCGFQIACYPTMIRWIHGSLILEEIMSLSCYSRNNRAPNTIFLSCWWKSITGHLEALMCPAFNYCNDFSGVTDE